MTDRVAIRRLPTGVPGLDQILGGGLPEFSFNVIAGAPGAGKTTLAQQIMFALSGPDRRALYFTVVGEPPLKMLRYQQQFTFFDVARVNESVRFVNLSRQWHVGQAPGSIVQEVEATSPGVVIVDSFRTVAQAAERAQNGDLDLQHFTQQLAVRLTGWEATTFLVGEYQPGEAERNPVFTVADGLLWLYQSLDRNSMVRKIQVMKMRGQARIPGLHTFRITGDGVEVFPRSFGEGPFGRADAPSRRASRPRHALPSVATCRRPLRSPTWQSIWSVPDATVLLHVSVSADVRGAVMQLWTAAREPFPARYAMGQLLPGTRASAVLLLVQPCDDGLHMYAEFLSYHGLAVIAVSDAWDALIAAPKSDVIVTGILLAGSMDGVELITRLRRDERADRRPIIVLTACAWDAERERATHAGCDLFLAKPCIPSELLRHVRASLADASLHRGRGKAVKADLLNAPCVTLGVAADSTQRTRTC